jgi:hypothetical protein
VGSMPKSIEFAIIGVEILGGVVADEMINQR